jgi:Fe-S-cluster-containing hydrogenase component 2
LGRGLGGVIDLLDDIEKNAIVKWEDVRASRGCAREGRAKKGPVAVIECLQEIPCNPCETGCRFGAIAVGDPMTSLPILDDEKCTGCGNCVAVCPGLAIFIEDESQEGVEALVSIPFEYLPVPERGAVVRAIDRSGRGICDARVTNVRKPKGFNKTAVVTIAVPREYVHEARGIAI